MKQDKKKSSGRNAQNKGQQNERRKKALARLIAQKASGVKPNPEKLEGGDVNIPLTEKDIVRIDKEISVLQSRITSL